MPMVHDALATILGLQVCMLAEKIRDLGLYSLSQQATRPLPQDFGELVVEGSWLNQLEHVILGHGISVLQWRSGGVKHPHDMPAFRFAPSPTFSDSSQSHSPALSLFSTPHTHPTILAHSNTARWCGDTAACRSNTNTSPVTSRQGNRVVCGEMSHDDWRSGLNCA